MYMKVSFPGPEKQQVIVSYTNPGGISKQILFKDIEGIAVELNITPTIIATKVDISDAI